MSTAPSWRHALQARRLRRQAWLSSATSASFRSSTRDRCPRRPEGAAGRQDGGQDRSGVGGGRRKRARPHLQEVVVLDGDRRRGACRRRCHGGHCCRDAAQRQHSRAHVARQRPYVLICPRPAPPVSRPQEHPMERPLSPQAPSRSAAPGAHRPRRLLRLGLVLSLFLMAGFPPAMRPPQRRSARWCASTSSRCRPVPARYR